MEHIEQTTDAATVKRSQSCRLRGLSGTSYASTRLDWAHPGPPCAPKMCLQR